MSNIASPEPSSDDTAWDAQMSYPMDTVESEFEDESSSAEYDDGPMIFADDSGGQVFADDGQMSDSETPSDGASDTPDRWWPFNMEADAAASSVDLEQDAEVGLFDMAADIAAGVASMSGGQDYEDEQMSFPGDAEQADASDGTTEGWNW